MNSRIMTSARNTVLREVKLPGEVKQINLPPVCGEPIDAGWISKWFEGQTIMNGTNLL
jgi:hypothetical protein